MPESPILPTAIRYAAYSGLLMAWLLALPFIARIGDVQAFAEGHVVEWFQFALVALAAVLLAIAAWRLPTWRGLLALLAGLAGLAAMREQDMLLDSLWIGWKLPALLCLGLGIFVATRDLPALHRQVRRFITTPGFGILWAALLTVIGAAQLIGHGDLLGIVMGDNYDGRLKRVVEEAFESFGYLLLLIGTIETLLWVRGAVSHRSPAGGEATEAVAEEEPEMAGTAR